MKSSVKTKDLQESTKAKFSKLFLGSEGMQTDTIVMSVAYGFATERHQVY